MRLSKQQAAARLEVSTATIERKIQRGELKAEKEPHGSRYRVWVIFDDDETPEAAVVTPVPAVEMARLQERNKALEELAGYHRQLLSDSEWRFQEMVHQLRQSNDTIATLSRALPEPKDESDDTASPAAAAPAEKERRRPRWWPFGRK